MRSFHHRSLLLTSKPNMNPLSDLCNSIYSYTAFISPQPFSTFSGHGFRHLDVPRKSNSYRPSKEKCLCLQLCSTVLRDHCFLSVLNRSFFRHLICGSCHVTRVVPLSLGLYLLNVMRHIELSRFINVPALDRSWCASFRQASPNCDESGHLHGHILHAASSMTFIDFITDNFVLVKFDIVGGRFFRVRFDYTFNY